MHRPSEINPKMVARLRAKQAEADAADREEFTRGYENGKYFATEVADVDQLRRLAAEAGPLSRFSGSGGELADRLYMVIHGVRRRPRYDEDEGDPVEQYWGDVLGFGGMDEVGDPDFARGFVEGGLAEWHQVEPQLSA